MSLDSKFEELYKRLNPEQKDAVDTIEGPVMVIAGPGTGKTTILTLRIANILLRTDTPPSGILALTFTDAGVKVMRQKLRDIIGSRADEVRIHTFHGFAASVIAEFDDHFPSLFRSTQITSVESEDFIRDILKDKKFSKLRPLGEVDFYVGKILGAISDCKKEAWTHQIIRSFATDEIERIKNDPEAISTRGATKGQIKADYLKRIERCQKTIIFADVYEAYELKKKLERKIDFDDLIFELLQSLEHDELLLQILQEKFLYILVDEHQDTNDSQNQIVSFLANFFDTPNIFVVGDEKQAIYRFQGASVQNFLRFQKIWKNMKIISLTSNYRSHQSILDATFKMIENNYHEGEYESLRVHLDSKSKEKQKPIDYILAGNNESADGYLVDELRKIIKNSSDDKVAIIVRRNRDVEYILSLCETNNISASAERGTDIFSHPLGAIYFNLLQYLIDPTYIEGLADTLAIGLWGVPFDKSTELIKKIRASVVADISAEIPALNDLQKEITKAGVLEYLILVANLSGLTLRMEEDPLSAEVWRTIIAMARDLALRTNINNPRELIKELLSYKKSAETKSIKIGAGIIDSQIVITTAHGSKGLEYDYVFLPFATEESWMHRFKTSTFVMPREKDDSDEIRDSRRLFYVALTRARKHAVIISSLKDDIGKDIIPLRFVDELDKSHVLQKNISAKNETVHKVSLDNLKSKRKIEMVEYVKRIILENGLSVTALNHFMECPSTFLYKSILKVPEAPSATSEKGIAMHKALSLVWKDSEKNVESIKNILDKSIREYFQTSLLPFYEKEVILEELIENNLKVSLALKDYFSLTGDVSVEKWVEENFSTQFNGKNIDFNLHGQLDVIIENDKKVEVFDYKTREAMSINAIKGDTQDSDGNYFRQLIFYKILLKNNSRFNDKEIFPALIFVKPDSKGRCQTITLPITDDDILKVNDEIEKLVESVWSGNFISDTCNDKECKWCSMKKEFFTE